MNISELFIKRPVATTLITIGIALAGAISFNMLPVSPLPQVDFPTISVQAQLPGASPQDMATSVATPLERSLGRIAGITEITSSSSLGATRITIQFDLDRDIDGAARDVQAAINGARSLLPTGLPSNPTYRKVNPADAPIMILALTSDTMSQGDMYDAASTILAQKLSQIRGVGQVMVGGSALPAVRVELNPDALNKYGIGLETVRTVIAGTNANRPKGSVETEDRHWQIYANDQATRASEYLPLIVAYRNGGTVRLSDIGTVTDSVQDLRNAGMSNGRPSVLVIINRQPGANIIETVDLVKKMLPNLRASVPASMNVKVAMDRTPTIRASLRDVERSLLVSTGLVILVVFLFLQNPRAALIPSVAVPVSLIGTFAVMHLAGFSLNNLSLMALTIAAGFVVDDAIVVLENISRHLEEGMSPIKAALKGAREVVFTVISMSLSLIGVFIPILLMGGIIGRLFREFAVTLSAAIIISMLISLTTTPMMCAQLLRQNNRGSQGAVGRFSDYCLNWNLSLYKRTLAWALHHKRFILVLWTVTVCLNIYLYAVIPEGFFPQQDTGRVMGNIQADQSISFQAMKQKLADFMNIIRNDPAVEQVVGFTGGGQRNTGMMFITLKPQSERNLSVDRVIARLRGKLSREPGANLFLQAVQDIRMGGRQSNSQYQYTLQGDDLKVLTDWEPRIRQALSQLPVLADVNTDQQNKGLETLLLIDRDTASRLGISETLIDATLNDAFGQRIVSTIYEPLNQYRVVMEAAPQYWQNPESLKNFYITTSSGTGVTEVPLSSFSRYLPSNAPLAVNRQGQFAASTISFNLPPGVSLSEASGAIDRVVKNIPDLPGSIYESFQGTAKAFQDSLRSQPWLILAALIAVYIVLGILYESYIHPITILSTLPSAGVGALLALLLCKTEFSVIALIGIFLLIGIVKKNAIMMIDFALGAERNEGLEPQQAIFKACLHRYRPIMMTTSAAFFGAIPLAIGFGEGAEIRQPLGISIVGGLVLSQLLTLYTTPVIYLYLDRFRFGRKNR